MQWTDEQRTIREANGRLTRVIAYAGTGKTSTLVAWAEAHPRLRILYLAFNKSVQKEAERRFPSHVTARTSHAVAYRVTGRHYQHKLVPSLRPYHVAQELGLDWVPHRERIFYAKLLIDTVQAFFASTAEAIDEELVVSRMPVGAGVLRRMDPEDVVRDTQTLWARMQDVNDRSIGMLHDGYLKLFVQQAPRLGYDAILFDEAQDANPVTLQLVQQQLSAQEVFVGDPWQAIYGFRGAINAMDALSHADATYRLTGSFRFGPTIADVATQILQWRDESIPPLHGFASDPGRLLSHGPTPAPVTIITRTNAQLFEEAVQVLVAMPTARLGFIGGIDGYRFDLIQEVYALWASQPVHDPFLRLFPSFQDLESYVTIAEDKEFLIRTKLVKKWQHDIPRWIQAIKAASGPLDKALASFATAHKAKGLEFATVRMGHDFADLTADAETWNEFLKTPPGRRRDELEAKLIPQEELNIWYVAATRAQKRLYLPNPAVHQLLTTSGSVSSPIQ